MTYTLKLELTCPCCFQQIEVEANGVELDQVTQGTPKAKPRRRSLHEEMSLPVGNPTASAKKARATHRGLVARLMAYSREMGLDPDVLSERPDGLTFVSSADVRLWLEAQTTGRLEELLQKYRKADEGKAR